VARLGGDEFAILLPDTAADTAAAVLRRVHERLGSLPEARSGLISVSIGLVTCTRCPGTHEALLRTADALMYEVKANGKNGMRHEVTASLGSEE
jgi:diguanylate cyclase (GGDEF)-like protein